MSKATVEQALTSLIPTINAILPSELVELAVSLLARSRSVANSLKPDEEIARPYACAQLACERLKKRLNLPTITPRPPCPPRIYTKLYKYLESALPASSSRAPETPRKGTAQRAAADRGTPKTPKTPKTPTSTRKTPLSNRKTPRSRAQEARNAQTLPEWIMPTIREVLRAFEYPMAAPHVFAGVESIFPLLVRMRMAESRARAAPDTPSKSRSRRASTATQGAIIGGEVSDSRVQALIAVILFYVLSRMMDQDITPEQYTEWRAKAVSTLLKSGVAQEQGMAEGDVLAEIEELLPMAAGEGWLQMEWFLNVFPEEEGEGDEMEGVEMGQGEGVERGSRGKKRPKSLKESLGSEYIGLGTMMQDANDYLGERQKEEYKRWREGIMRRIEEIEAA